MRLPRTEAKRVFHLVNSSFNRDPVLVQIVPVLGASRNTQVQPKVSVEISVNALAVSGIGAGMVTSTDSAATPTLRFVTHPLEAERTVLSSALAEI